ncbi:hypothetical protein Q3G72_030698 [Acer saccharum]|nr:hypothetical protein Q3G72_030698 [Acer saccharum]
MNTSELHCRPKKIVKREYWRQCRLPRNFNINLQEDALDRIISFSPVKIGMKTTILSTRFQHSWKNSRILYNGEINIYKGGRSCFQSPFRSNHPNPSTEVHSNRSRKLCSQMDRKVRGEESRGVELDFLYATVQFELSPEFFNVESLRMVKINHCAVELLPLLKGSTFLNSLLQKRTAQVSAYCNIHRNHFQALHITQVSGNNSVSQEIDHYKEPIEMKNIKDRGIRYGKQIKIHEIEVGKYNALYKQGRPEGAANPAFCWGPN